MRVRIVSTGLYAPPTVETAADLAPLVGRSAGWIERRTGVIRRHVSDEPVEVLAAAAARDALGDGPAPDLIVYASATPRQLIPDTSVFVMRELGLDGVAGYTMHATCLSFVVALHHAAAMVHAGAFRRVLVVSAERGTTSRDLAEPESAVLLGDGAGAAVVEATPEGEASAWLGLELGTWPEFAHLASLEGAGVLHHPNDPATRPEHNLFHMNGPKLYRAARHRVGRVLDRLFEANAIGPEDIDLVVPHQASGPALAAVPRYGFAPDRVVDVVAEYGNCIAASIPMALAHADAEGRLRRGDRVLLVGTGAGLSVGAALLRW